MLEEKMLQIDRQLIERKCAVRQRLLDSYSYLNAVRKIDRGYRWRPGNDDAEVITSSFLNFLGCTDAINEKIRQSVPTDVLTQAPEAAVNYSLHVSALFNRECLLPSLDGKKLARDHKKMNLDVQHYSSTVPELIRCNLHLMGQNLGSGLLVVQEYFLAQVIDATCRNGTQLSYKAFNDEMKDKVICLQNGTLRSYRSYTDLKDLMNGSSVTVPDSNEKVRKKPFVVGGNCHLQQTADSNHKPPVDIRFEDIAGYKELKKTFQRMKRVLTEDNVYQRAGVPIPNGYLIYGPPGTGKTTLVYAFANECGWPFYEASIADIIDKYYGESEKKIRNFLQQKGVLLIDEFDSLGRKKSQGGDNGQLIANVNNVIATELNRYDPERILFAVTNSLDQIDPKLKGRRLGSIILVDYPDQPDCAEIIRLKLASASQRSEGYDYTEVDAAEVAEAMVAHAQEFTARTGGRHNVGFSGADIENLLYEVIRNKSDQLFDKGEMVIPTVEDYLGAIHRFDFRERQI